MTNNEIRERIEVLRSLARQYESDLTLGEISEEKYYQLNHELMDEIEILEETARDNNFDEMMGHPIKTISGWFR